jgi:putative addiction module killer protein
MIAIEHTERYDTWLSTLRDRSAAAIVTSRVARVGRGLMGDVKYVGSGISELRIDYGPGYRVYFTYRGKTLILLLCGGDKSTQSSDIRAAKAMAAER